jgi:DNA polymerase III epsilon subunit-like protein
MRVVGVDFETTSLDINKARIIEIGAVLYNVQHGEWIREASLSTLVYELGDDPLSPETVKVTGITDAQLMAEGKPLIPAIQDLAAISAEAELAVAHNAAYDGGVLQAVNKKRDLDVHAPMINYLLSMQWICSVMDLQSNRNFKCRTLSHLAIDRGIAVDPKDLHRAVNDVILMGKVLTAAKADPAEMLRYQQSPWVFLAAIIPPPWEDGGKGKDAATKLGYSWQKARGTDGPEIPKTWVKRVKDCDVEDERKAAQFPVKIIQV